MSARLLPTALALAVLAACEPEREVAHGVPGGDPERGEALFRAYGCETCHMAPGVRAWRGLAGPPLDGWARRDFIAGAAPNTPGNLVAWIMDPDVLEPGTAMPDLDVSEAEARDIAAYLFTLRDTETGGDP